MARRSPVNWCMFGVQEEKADKGVVVGYNKKFGNWSCSIYRLKEPVEYGKRWERDNVENEIIHLCFCNKKSLDGFIKQLMILKVQWEIKEKQEEGNG